MRSRIPVGRAAPRVLEAALVLALCLAACAAPVPPAAERAGPSPAGPSSARLKIASWNIAWLNRRDGQGHVPRRQEDYARLGAYARRLDADVVALQEIDGCEAALRVFDPAVYRCLVTRDTENDQRTGFVVRKGLEVRPHPDVAGLSIGGTRRGADIEVRAGDAAIRLLAVHLKSGCHTGALDSGREACDILRRQVPVLESWIDARARERVPFAVVGDFNRVFGRHDRLWAEIDDGDPPGARLVDAGAGRRPECWGGKYRSFVDHIVLDRRSAGWLVAGSFEQMLYAAADARFEPALSDHCPIAVTLQPGGGPAPEVPTYPASAAARHAGEYATVCGRVAGATFAASVRGRPTFLNLDRPHPHQPFTVLIWGEDRPAFGRPEVALLNKRICVTGTIALHKGKPEIVASDPGQIAPAAGEVW